ncbi:hypothetical protein [Breoghania sp. JC706]|uniref:hypothetical protein n=1 Tax=Breoghania sp. JC706 TaxID=3117732 RepID=UPI00300A25C4
MTAPIPFHWDGDAMVPLTPFRKRADDVFVIGQVYRLEEIEERSAKSHKHYFACIREAWQNLPEEWADKFPTPEHLRKWALIMCGYADERSIVCASKAEALRLAAFIRPMDDFAVVVARENVVKAFTPQSQSTRTMGQKPFQESKDAVLDKIAQLIGTDAATLKRNAGMAA